MEKYDDLSGIMVTELVDIRQNKMELQDYTSGLGPKDLKKEQPKLSNSTEIFITKKPHVDEVLESNDN